MAKVTVIVPVFNAEKTIEACLKSILRNIYPDYEVIVVNDGSTDNTANIVSRFPVRLITLKENFGAGYARNIGIENAQGEIVAFIDADCVAEENWLSKLVQNICGEVVGVTGLYKTLNNKTRVSLFVGYDITYRFLKCSNFTDILGTYNCAIKKSILKEIKFDVKIKGAAWEDTKLGLLISRKHKLVIDKNCFVFHLHADSILIFLRKQFLKAKGQIRLRKEGYASSYVTGNIYAQVLFTSLFLSSIPFVFHKTFLFIAGMGLSGLLVINIPFFKYILSQKENITFLPFATGMILLRNLAWLLGAIQGIINQAKPKKE